MSEPVSKSIYIVDAMMSCWWLMLTRELKNGIQGFFTFLDDCSKECAIYLLLFIGEQCLLERVILVMFRSFIKRLIVSWFSTQRFPFLKKKKDALSNPIENSYPVHIDRMKCNKCFWNGTWQMREEKSHFNGILCGFQREWIVKTNCSFFTRTMKFVYL